MTEDQIKQIVMQCRSQAPDAPIDPKGIYCDNLEVLEFARKVEAAVALMEKAVALKYARIERDLCIEFVESLNPEVATKLREKRGHM
jgi:hypothetical protein